MAARLPSLAKRAGVKTVPLWLWRIRLATLVSVLDLLGARGIWAL
jgi:hypothetical protein